MAASAIVPERSFLGAQEYFVPHARLGERLIQRGIVAPEGIQTALADQKRWGCRVGEALIAEGAVTPVELAESLADGFGVSFLDLIADPPNEDLCRSADTDLYLARLFLPWRRLGGALVVACADPTAETRRFIADRYGPDTLVAITAKFDVIWTVQRLFRETLVHDAVFRLQERAPQFSAHRVVTRAQALLGIAAVFALGAGFAAAPALTATMFLLLLSLCYCANIVLRLALFCAAGLRATGHRVAADDIASLDERELPVFSILVPLYREAEMVESVARALRALDYPAAKLDIKLVLEGDDFETIVAAKALKLDGRFEILCVPPSQPRTKPKACNYALRFVRGEYVVVYDAEDRPDPDQLKKVAAAFRHAAPDVACFQARLNVYNARDNWLTRGLMEQTPEGAI